MPNFMFIEIEFIDFRQKKEIMDKLLKMYKFNMTDGAKVEMKRRGMENLLSQYNIK